MGMSLSLAEAVSYWANWALVISLVVGVIATFAIIVSGNVKEAALKRELAASAERTAAAELKTEQIRLRIAPRFMKRDAFLKALEGQPTGKVEILYLRDDPECMEVAQNIALLLEEAKWVILSRAPLKAREDVPGAEGLPSMMTVGGQPSGITVIAPSAREEELGAVWNRVTHKPWAKTPFTVLQVAISDGLGRVSAAVGAPNPPPEGVLRITVAPKGTAG